MSVEDRAIMRRKTFHAQFKDLEEESGSQNRLNETQG